MDFKVLVVIFIALLAAAQALPAGPGKGGHGKGGHGSGGAKG